MSLIFIIHANRSLWTLTAHPLPNKRAIYLSFASLWRAIWNKTKRTSHLRPVRSMADSQHVWCAYTASRMVRPSSIHRCPSRTTWMYPEGGTHFTGNHNIKPPIGHLTLRGPGQRRHHGIRNGNQTPSYQSIIISTYRGKHGSFVLSVWQASPCEYKRTWWRSECLSNLAGFFLQWNNENQTNQ